MHIYYTTAQFLLNACINVPKSYFTILINNIQFLYFFNVLFFFFFLINVKGNNPFYNVANIMGM